MINTVRFFEAMILELSLDQKRLEDEMERIINSDDSLGDKMFTFKKLLNQMVVLDSSIAKFNQIVVAHNENKIEK